MITIDAKILAAGGGDRVFARESPSRNVVLIQFELCSAHDIQNAFFECLNGRVREELLNETVFTSLAEPRVALGCWQPDFYEGQPYSQLVWRTPEFTFTSHLRREQALRYAESSALPPLQLHTGAPAAGPSSGQDKTWGKIPRRFGEAIPKAHITSGSERP